MFLFYNIIVTNILRLRLFGCKTFSEEYFPSFLVFGRIGKCNQRKTQIGQRKTIIKICLVFCSLFYSLIFRKTSYLSALALYSVDRSLSSFLLSLSSPWPTTLQQCSSIRCDLTAINYCLLSPMKTPSTFILVL